VARREQAALDVATNTRRFQMQSHRSTSGVWEAMENGAAAHVWRPRPTAVDAVSKCLSWTGFVGIPAMQVVDLATGVVVWRLGSEYDPDAGDPVKLPAAEQERAERMARAVLADRPRPEDDDPDEDPDDEDVAGEQATLF
jgi:hypothetical protein